MGAENHIEGMVEEENHSLGKVLQCPVWYTIRAWSLAETPDGLVNLIGVDHWGSLAGLKK